MSNISNLGNFPHTIGNLDDRPNLTAAQMKAAFEQDVMTLWAKLAQAIPYINDILPASKLVDVVNNTSTDSGVPTAKAVYDAIADASLGGSAQQIIDDWLDAHPEATTTVTDGSITNAKLSSSFVTPGVAAAYVSNTFYPAGSYVFQGGVLYTNEEDVNDAVWTAEHWAPAALGDDVTDVNKRVNDVCIPFINLFNQAAVLKGYYCDKVTGDLVAGSAFYVSDFIEVNAGQEYKIAVGLGSPNDYPTALFYDENKDLLSVSFNPSVSGYNITTPSSCAYIRVNGALSRLNQQMVTALLGASYIPYEVIVNGYQQTGFNLISEDNIFYDRSTGVLSSTSDIAITFPNSALLHGLGTTVNVGAGRYLFYDISTHTLYASDSYSVSKHDVLLAFLELRKFDGKQSTIFLAEAFPIFTFDAKANTLSINVTYTPAYIVCNGAYYGLPVGFSQVLTLPNLCDVYYDPSANEFIAGTDFNRDHLKGILIMTRHYRRLTVINGATVNTVLDNMAGKKIICYGDSLTWYDGQEFTWGPHQGETCVGFESYLINELNVAAASNYGQSGITTPEICANIVSQKANLVNYDYMTIMGGDNDDRLSVSVGTVQPVGGTFDTSTVCGALQNAIEQALAVNPSLRIILMTEPMGWTYQNGRLDRVSDLIPEAYRNVAKQYGLPLIDNWSNSGINEITRNTYYADPPDTENQMYMYHPNNDGWVRISKNIVNCLRLIG